MAIGGDTGGLKLANLCVLYQSLCSLYACVQSSVLPFLSVDTPMLVWDLGEGGESTKEKKRKERKKYLDLSCFVLKDFCSRNSSRSLRRNAK